MLNNNSNNNLTTAVIGFCISEKLGLYIANNHIIGFKHHWINGNNVITLCTSYQSFIIYEHIHDYLDFNNTAHKIIMKIMESIRYDITSNINIDKIIDEVLNDV